MTRARPAEQVRASNLLDLIYKRGQAGVTRASVTIVFDNSDKSKAPVGFDKMDEISVTRQIALNGTSKYLICGHRSTQQAVQNLFQSVQLNINNPNFVIMQGKPLISIFPQADATQPVAPALTSPPPFRLAGKITKVLNMRPQEILGMIEEAAGTSMFEEKKDKAVKTMAKKEKRLDEIQELLREEITPKLDKLRDEKRDFLEFQKKSSELERLSKVVIAWDWTHLERRKDKAARDVDEAAVGLKAEAEGKKRMEGEVETMKKEVKAIENRRDKVSRTAYQGPGLGLES